ncbi:MAG: hypothetical protein M0P59_10455, partial [Gallionella sp.]|nr:hypothetical protein [Gallionella sp.]
PSGNLHHCYSGLPQHRIPLCHIRKAACFFGEICGIGPITSLTNHSTGPARKAAQAGIQR